MNKVAFIVIALLIAMGSASYAETQTWTWNFNDGLGGWTTGTALAAPGLVTPPTGVNPNANFNDNSQCLLLPDKSYAYFDLAGLGASLSGGASRSFTFSAIVGFDYNTSTSELQACGIGLHNTKASYSGVSFWFEGRNASSERMNHAGDGTFFSGGAANTAGMLRYKSNGATINQTETVRLILDYNHMQAGKLVTRLEGITYQPYGDSNSDWIVEGAAFNILPDATEGGQYYSVNKLRLGGDNSWTQALFDNVSFTAYDAVVPEPGSMLALATGLFGLLGIIRRRK